MFVLVLLGANSFNQVLFGASLGFTFAMILNSWIKPFFLDLQQRFTKKQMAESNTGDEVYEDRYILKGKHFAFVLIFTFIFPLATSGAVLNSYGDHIDGDLKTQVILQKVWLGNQCPINIEEASEIMQYKHFLCECTIVGLFGIWLG